MRQPASLPLVTQRIELLLQRLNGKGNADRYAVAALVLLCLWPFWRLMLLGEHWLNGDLILANQVWAEWQAARLSSGEFPFWTSDILGGFPIAFSEYPWFYPLHWPFLLLLPSSTGYAAAMVAHLCIAALGLYTFVRVLGLSPVAAFLAGSVYALNTFTLGTLHFNNFSPLFALMPLALLGVHWLLERRWWGWALLSVTIALALLGGHPQLFGYLFLLPTVYALSHLAGAIRHSLRHGLFLALSLGTAAATGAAISLVRWLPTLALVAESARGSGDTAGGVSVAPWSFLLGFVFLDFFIPRVLTAQGLLFVGALPVVFAIVGATGWRSSLPVRAVVVTLTASAIMALGAYTPLYGLLQQVSGFSFFRDPHRAVVTVNASIALLAAFGVDRLLSDTTLLAGRVVRYSQRTLIALSALLALGGLLATLAFRLFEPRIAAAGRSYVARVVLTDPTKLQSPAFYYNTMANEIAAVGRSLRLDEPLVPFYALSLLGAGLALLWLRRRQHHMLPIFFVVVVAAGTLLVGNRNLVPSESRSFMNTLPAAVNAVRADAAPGRIFGWRLGGLRHEIENTQSLDPTGADYFSLQYRTTIAALAPNRSVAYGIPSLDGYENLMTARQDAVLNFIGSERAHTPSFVSDSMRDTAAKREIFLSRLPVLAKLGVRFITSLEVLNSPLLTLIAQETIPLTGGQITVYTYRLEKAAPLLFLAGEYAVADGPDKTLSILGAEELVLEREPDLTIGSRLTPSGSTVRIANLGNHRAEIMVQTDGAGLMVWLQAPLSGWTAHVDGQPAEIIPANVLGMAVPIDADTRRVEMRYAPPGFALGLRLAALGLLALLAGTLLHLRGLPLKSQSARQAASGGSKM